MAEAKFVVVTLAEFVQPLRGLSRADVRTMRTRA